MARAAPRVRSVQVRRGIAALCAAAHALAIALAWHASAPRAIHEAPRVSVRWVSVAPVQVATDATARSQAAARETERASAWPASSRERGAHARIRATHATPVRAERRTGTSPDVIARPTSPEDVRPTSAEPVVGVAMALPRIGGFGAAPSRWLRAPTAEVPPVPHDAYVAQMMQAQAVQDAARAQIAIELQRHLADASLQMQDGACALGGEPEARLACDNETLAQSLAPREAVLAGLLRAYRSMEPRASGLAIAVVQGRAQVTWHVDAALQ
jgi:hypothetical protein